MICEDSQLTLTIREVIITTKNQNHRLAQRPIEKIRMNEGHPAQGRKYGRTGDTQQAIASIVRGLPKGTHLTAPEVFEKAKAIGLEISLSTVYRILNRLKAVGNVMTVAGERGLRYETAEKGPEHDHLICLGCGLTIEFVDELIRGFGRTVALRKGFEHKSSRFDILGYCRECNSKDESRQSERALQCLSAAQAKLDQASSLMRQTLEHAQAGRQMKALRSGEACVEEIKTTLSDCESALALIARNPTDRSPLT
jgi:Fur family ferric uptake transcriptional regulator